MAATERASRRRRPLLLGVAVLVALVVVALRADRADEVRALPPLPATSRDDLTLAVEARRTGGGVTVALVLGVAPTAEAALRVVDWGGDAEGWSVDGSWDAGAGPGWRWTPAVRDERLPGGQVVLHVGTGGVIGREGIPPIEPRVDRVRSLRPGREVGAAVRTELPRITEVRVCVWTADAGPDDPGDRPAACADDRLPAPGAR